MHDMSVRKVSCRHMGEDDIKNLNDEIDLLAPSIVRCVTHV
jgi:hypothetical protein